MAIAATSLPRVSQAREEKQSNSTGWLVLGELAMHITSCPSLLLDSFATHSALGTGVCVFLSVDLLISFWAPSCPVCSSHLASRLFLSFRAMGVLASRSVHTTCCQQPRQKPALFGTRGPGEGCGRAAGRDREGGTVTGTV